MWMVLYNSNWNPQIAVTVSLARLFVYSLIRLCTFICPIQYVLSKFLILWQHNLCSRIVNLFCIKTVTIVFVYTLLSSLIFPREYAQINKRAWPEWRSNGGWVECARWLGEKQIKWKYRTRVSEWVRGERKHLDSEQGSFCGRNLNIFNHITGRVHTLFSSTTNKQNGKTNERTNERTNQRWEKDPSQIAIPIAIWLFTFIYTCMRTHMHTLINYFTVFDAGACFCFSILSMDMNCCCSFFFLMWFYRSNQKYIVQGRARSYTFG